MAVKVIDVFGTKTMMMKMTLRLRILIPKLTKMTTMQMMTILLLTINRQRTKTNQTMKMLNSSKK